MNVLLNLLLFVGVFYLMVWFACRPARSDGYRRADGGEDTRKVA